MSFQDKISSLMARPGQDPVAKDDVPWWMKVSGRGLGTVGGFIAIFLGVWNCTGIIGGNVSALLAGIWQILAGFLVICVEAPCCCMFVEPVQKFSDFAEGRPYWNRALVYWLLAIVPILMDFGFSTLFGSGLVFATGVIYGTMAIGRKGTAEAMRQAALADTSTTHPSPKMHSNLVANAQPISFTGAPVFDSNV